MLRKQAEVGSDVLTDDQIRDEVVDDRVSRARDRDDADDLDLPPAGTAPQVIAELHAELDDVHRGRDAERRAPAVAAVHEQILLESMRMYPPAYALQRRALVDYEIGDCPVPEGSILRVQPVDPAS